MHEIILDTETTGFEPSQGHRIVEIGCIELIDGLPTGRTYHTFINPERDVPRDAFDIHGLSTEFLATQKPFRDIYLNFLNIIGLTSPLVIHNARFDMKFLNAELKSVGEKSIPYGRAIDTLGIAQEKFPGSPCSLDALCKRFKIDNSKRDKHNALLDAELLRQVYLELNGGRQSNLFSNESINVHKPSIVVQKKEISPRLKRTFLLSEAEKDNHSKFLQKIKNPIWSD